MTNNADIEWLEYAIREMLDFAVGFTRVMTPQERLDNIAKIGNAALYEVTRPRRNTYTKPPADETVP